MCVNALVHCRFCRPCFHSSTPNATQCWSHTTCHTAARLSIQSNRNSSIASLSKTLHDSCVLSHEIAGADGFCGVQVCLAQELLEVPRITIAVYASNARNSVSHGKQTVFGVCAARARARCHPIGPLSLPPNLPKLWELFLHNAAVASYQQVMHVFQVTSSLGANHGSTHQWPLTPASGRGTSSTVAKSRVHSRFHFHGRSERVVLPPSEWAVLIKNR